MKTEKIITELLEQMTLDEKIGMVHGNGLFQNKGVERLGIPSMKFSDGPMGVRNEFQNDNGFPWEILMIMYLIFQVIVL